MKENQLNSLQNAHWDFCLHKTSLVVFKWEKDPSLPFLSAERSSFASLKQKLKEGKPVTHTSVILMCLKKKKKKLSEGNSLFGSSLLQKNPIDFAWCLPPHLNFTQPLVIP